ncbi:hypothetical protein GCM10007049_14990 [Echinicola pacifica]|uniref:DUF4271 domain-containing protein n=1 Tax=Echinicola pacifica TaxID=346377 RepID=A0A918UNR0_9BACT|nr:hypothetical protein GCM10007049_14990 [Echinicola pacifica]
MDILEDFRKVHRYIVSTLLVLLAGLTYSYGQVLENYNPKIQIKEKYELVPSAVEASVDLNIGSFPNSSFRMSFPDKSAVFLADRLWFYAQSDTNIRVSMAELATYANATGTASLALTIYKKGISREDLDIKKGVWTRASDLPRGAEPSKEALRAKDDFKDFLILAFVVILSLVALFKVTYPIVFQESLRPVTVFVEDSDGPSGVRVFSSDVLFTLLVFSMLLALFAMAGIHFMKLPIPEAIQPEDLNGFLLVWLSMAVLFMGFSYLKYIWIKIFSAIYHLDKTDFSQFFYMVRGLMMALLILFVVLLGFYLQGYAQMDRLIEILLSIFLSLYLLGLLRLFYLMIKKVPFKSYHLFSYLCSSELVPFLIIVKLVMG